METNILNEKSIYGPLLKYIENEDITDIDYNGKALWIRDCKNIRKQVDEDIPEGFLDEFVQHVANSVSKDFNKLHPLLEAETPNLRISVLREPAVVSGLSLCIRKTPPFARITVQNAYENDYATVLQLSLLHNLVKAHRTVMICGEPGVGKTEFAKFLSGFIPEDERVITIEDSLEWRYRELKPSADCVEMQVSDVFTIDDALKASLRQNPKWLMVSELRGEEVSSYIKNISAGMKSITTLHTDDVRNVIDRICNMSANPVARERMETDLYTFLDAAVLISMKENPDTGECKRFVDQLCFFYSANGKKHKYMVFDNGKLVSEALPEAVVRKFNKEGVSNPFISWDIQEMLGLDIDEYIQNVPNVGTELNQINIDENMNQKDSLASEDNSAIIRKAGVW